MAKLSATPKGSEVRKPPPSTSTPSKQAVNRPAPAAGASPAPDRKPPKPSDSTVPKGSQGAAPQPARRLSELPEPVRRRIPTLTLGGVVYSSVPASRLVVVNGQVLREGESAGKGVKLERVTPLGAIFSFDGYRFEILQ